MTNLEIVDTFQIADYHFQVCINPANVAAGMQRDVFYKIGAMDDMFLRSFFFDDIVPETIFAFCEQFADDADYRSDSLNRTVDWAICNDLFLRNCFNPYFQPNPVLEQSGSMVRAYQFFKDHAPNIIQHPDYQRIVQYDSAIEPHAQAFDPDIAEIVVAFNQIEGVRTLASCQGVSETIRYQNYDIMTLSPHARYAYIWFAALPSSIAIKFKQTQIQATIYKDDIYPTLQSTGRNAVFLAEIGRWLSQSTK